MKILIIEDEYITSEELKRDIEQARPDAQVVAQLESVEEALAFLKTEPTLDLIFSDIQLSDGLSFEVFEQITPPCPIVFCTAFDEYAIQAFNNNGIDYILKPFERKTIAASLSKFENMKTYFQGSTQDKTADKAEDKFNQNLQKLLSDLRTNTHRSSFLVQFRGKYFPIATTDIAYFYTEHDNVWLVRMSGEKYPVNHKLDELEKSVDDTQFYRANRQFLINFDAIKEFEPYFNRKLSIKLKVPTTEQLLVSKEKATHFMRWMETREVLAS